MRTIILLSLLSAVLLAAAITAPVPGVAQTTASSSIQLAQAQKRTPSAACAAARKSCYAGRTITTSSGARAVPPEVVRECEGAYRSCISRR